MAGNEDRKIGWLESKVEFLETRDDDKEKRIRTLEQGYYKATVIVAIASLLGNALAGVFVKMLVEHMTLK